MRNYRKLFLLIFLFLAPLIIWFFIWSRNINQKQTPNSPAALTPAPVSPVELERINTKIWAEIEKELNTTLTFLNCSKIVSGDAEYIFPHMVQRITYSEPANLPMDCASIRARNHFVQRPLSMQEADFPIAYARVAYVDYRFLEMELATNYQPQNLYCFPVDKKASPLFQRRMRALAGCFSNVIIPENEYSVDSAGHQMSSAFMECLKHLARPDRRWNYLITLQNHDVQVKSNEELVRIFQWLDGASDIEYEFEHEGPQEMIKSLHQKFPWTFEHLKLFKNASLNERKDSDGAPLSLWLAKGVVQGSLSRPFVDFIVSNLDLTIVMAQLNEWNYGADELFFQTLGSSDALNAPGAFTHKCIERKIKVPYITRYSVWDYGPNRWENVGTCHSAILRHFICILGIEDLSQTVVLSKHLFVNKMIPSSDFGAILCWHEEIRKRTLSERGLHRLDPKFYQNWPQTRFYQEYKRTGGKVDREHFNCSEYS